MTIRNEQSLWKKISKNYQALYGRFLGLPNDQPNFNPDWDDENGQFTQTSGEITLKAAVTFASDENRGLRAEIFGNPMRAVFLLIAIGVGKESRERSQGGPLPYCEIRLKCARKPLPGR